LGFGVIIEVTDDGNNTMVIIWGYKSMVNVI